MKAVWLQKLEFNTIFKQFCFKNVAAAVGSTAKDMGAVMFGCRDTGL